MSASLREAMPVTAAFIDELREVFGRESIDAQIRAGVRGVPVFWASEGGHEIGTNPPGGRVVVCEGNDNGK
jgi:hypothetical protein